MRLQLTIPSACPPAFADGHRQEPATRLQYRSVSGKLCIVTGANAGVGLEVTLLAV